MDIKLVERLKEDIFKKVTQSDSTARDQQREQESKRLLKALGVKVGDKVRTVQDVESSGAEGVVTVPAGTMGVVEDINMDNPEFAIRVTFNLPHVEYFAPSEIEKVQSDK